MMNKIEKDDLFESMSNVEFYDVFADIKSDRHAIYVYGAGALAMRVVHRLQEEGIRIEGIVVDREYLINNTFGKYQVTDFDSLSSVAYEYSIVMGLSNYLMGISKKERYQQISKVYCIVDVPYRDIAVKKEDLVKNRNMFVNAMSVLGDKESIDCLCAWIKCSISGTADYCYQLAKHEQSYFRNDIFHLSSEESMLDIGAFNGDTIKQFYDQCKGKYTHIYGIEGEKTNFIELEDNLIRWGITERISLFNRICYKDDRTVSFNTMKDENDGYHIIKNDKGIATTTTLDELLYDRKKITIIKMNFPDSLDVLKGAECIIAEDKPKLAIMAGWGSMLAVEMIQFIHQTVHEYKIYLRYASAMPSRIMLLATVD